MKPHELKDLKSAKREIYRLRRTLAEHIRVSRVCIDAIDSIFKLPTSQERGQQAARIANALEIGTDMASHFGLGIPLRKPRSGERAKTEASDVAAVDLGKRSRVRRG